MIVGLVAGCAACENLAAQDAIQTDLARMVVEPYVREHLASHAPPAETASRDEGALSDVPAADAEKARPSASGRVRRSTVRRAVYLRLTPTRFATLGALLRGTLAVTDDRTVAATCRDVLRQLGELRW